MKPVIKKMTAYQVLNKGKVVKSYLSKQDAKKLLKQKEEDNRLEILLNKDVKTLSKALKVDSYEQPDLKLNFYNIGNGFYHTKSKMTACKRVVISPSGQLKLWSYYYFHDFSRVINGKQLDFINSKKLYAKRGQHWGWLYTCQLPKHVFEVFKKKSPDNVFVGLRVQAPKRFEFAPTKLSPPVMKMPQEYYNLQSGDAQRRFSNAVKAYLANNRYSKKDVEKENFLYKDIKALVEANRIDPNKLWIERRQISDSLNIHVEHVISKFGDHRSTYWQSHEDAMKEMRRLKKWADSAAKD